ncbi:MAG: hypothetical protein ACE5GX_08650 [Thermoanaerobaculia bacterium]
MTRLAIWNADSLLGREIKDALAGRRDLWTDLRLLSEASEGALVTDIGGEAALIQPAKPENLKDLDLLFYCAEPNRDGEIPEVVPRELPTVLVASEPRSFSAPPIVAGVNSHPKAIQEAGGVVASAHPAIVGLAHLLHPLLGLGLEACTATVVLPSSSRGQEGIDALLDQTRSILAFQPQEENEIFHFQLAFNLVPDALAGDLLARQLGEVLEADLELAVQSSLGGIFHGVTLSAHVRLGEGTTASTLQSVLEATPLLEPATRPESLGPISAAGSSSIRLAPVAVSTAADSFWLRAVMDNLTVGGALNAIGVAEAVLAATSDDGGYTM